MTESEAKSGPPAGFETKNTPGTYTTAAVPAGDHPGHAVGFAGKPGYTNTVGIGDPEPAPVAAEPKPEGDDGQTPPKADDGKTPAKTTGSAAKTPAK